jgi:plastocyanin domain-containing protein
MKCPDDVGVNTKNDKELYKPDGRKTNKKLPILWNLWLKKQEKVTCN